MSPQDSTGTYFACARTAWFLFLPEFVTQRCQPQHFLTYLSYGPESFLRS